MNTKKHLYGPQILEHIESLSIKPLRTFYELQHIVVNLFTERLVLEKRTSNTCSIP